MPEPTRSMAPPIPLSFLPGISQLERSPLEETCIPPMQVMLRCFPRMIPKETEVWKVELPGMVLMVSFPALIKSESS